MRIKKAPARRLTPLVQQKDCSNMENLVKELEDSSQWSIPKSDLGHWISLLNVFDSYLKNIVTDYQLDKLQLRPFDETTKNLLLRILETTKLLFDSDLDILIANLSLILRPAQKVNSQRSVRANYNISPEKIYNIIKSLRSIETKVGFNSLCSDSVNLPPDSLKLYYQFYNMETSENEQKKSKSKKSTTKNMTEIKINNLKECGEDFYKIYQNILEKYKVDEKHSYELYNLIRILLAMKNDVYRIKLMAVRLLATSIMIYTSNDVTNNSEIYFYEPNLIANLSLLISTDNNYNPLIQTSAIYTLDAISRQRTKLPHILNALNATANHGTILSILRKFTSNPSEDSPYPLHFMDVFFSFISLILTTQNGGNMLVTSGIIPVLVEILAKDYAIIPIKLFNKILPLLDTCIYDFTNSFDSFQSHNGLDILLNMIKDFVDHCVNCIPVIEKDEIESTFDMDRYSSYTDHFSLLKSMLKFLLHMMQSSGTVEGLRTLIESSLPDSIKKMIENYTSFNPHLYGMSVSILATFIHNEPTSLTILQEAKLPQCLLKSLENGIPSLSDAFMPISNSLGAICLNDNGLKMLLESNTLEKLFDIFLSIPHSFVLQDGDLPSILGSSIDELVRHHPSLKTPIFKIANVVIERLLSINADFEKWSSDNQNIMNAIRYDFIPDSVAQEYFPGAEFALVQTEKDTSQKVMLNMIECYFRFLEGFFQNAGLCKEFTKFCSFDLIMDFYTLPCIPYTFFNNAQEFTLTHVVRTCSQNNFKPVMDAIMKKLDSTLIVTSTLLENNLVDKIISELDQEKSHSFEEDFSRLCANFTAIHGLITLFADFCSTPVFNHGRNSWLIVSLFAEPKGQELLVFLGNLHRTCIRKNIELKETKLINEIKDSDLLEEKYTYLNENVKKLYSLLVNIPSSLTDFFQGLIRLLSSRRTMDNTQKKNSLIVASKFSQIFSDHFRFAPSKNENIESHILYLTAIFGLLSVFFLDDRNQMFVNIILVVAFEKDNGIQKIFDSFQLIYNVGLLIIETDIEKFKKDYNVLLEVYFAFIELLISYKLYNESPHMHILFAKQNGETEATLSPNDYLMKARKYAGKIVIQLWSSDIIKFTNSNIISSLVKITTRVIKAQLIQREFDIPRPSNAARSLPTISNAEQMEPDEDVVGQLVDMGFPRDAALSALQRCHNDVVRAAEYLVTHPDVVATANFRTTQENVNEQDENTDNENESSNEDGDEENNSSEEEMSIDVELTTQDPEYRDFIQQYKPENIPKKEDLSKLKNDLMELMPKRCLELTCLVDDTIYPIRNLFLAFMSNYEDDKTVLNMLMEEIRIKLLDPADHENELGNRIRIFNLLLIEPTVYKMVLPLSTLLFDQFVDAVAYQIDNGFTFSDLTLASVLLTIELVVSVVDVPVKEILKHELGSDDRSSPLPQSDISTDLVGDKRKKILQICLDIIKTDKIREKDVMLAACRIFVRLTRDFQLAQQFMDNEGFKKLLQPLKEDIKEFKGQHILLTIMIRHCIENHESLTMVMKYLIVKWFSGYRNKPVDIATLIKHNFHLALRDPSAFVEAVGKVCKLSKYESHTRSTQIGLEDKQMVFGTKEWPSVPKKVSEVVWGLMHGLMPRNKKPLKNEDKMDTESADDKPGQNMLYKTFLLQLLAELVLNYPNLRCEFGRLKKDNSKAKYKSQFVMFVLNDLLPYPELVTKTFQTGENQGQLNELASMFLCALVVGDTDTVLDPESVEVYNVRKYVLDAILKAFKMALDLNDLHIKYMRMVALAELCFRIVGKKVAKTTSTNSRDEEVSNSVVRLMIELNFVSVLVSCVDHLDFNYPNINKIVSAIIKPLELIAKAATTMGNSSELTTSSKDTRAMDFESGEESDMPFDLYRNSALGMYEGNADHMDDEEDSEESEDSDGMEEEFGNSTEVSDESEDMEIELSHIDEDETEQMEDEEMEVEELEAQHSDSWQDEDDTDDDLIDETEEQYDDLQNQFELVTRGDDGEFDDEMDIDLDNDNRPFVLTRRMGDEIRNITIEMNRPFRSRNINMDDEDADSIGFNLNTRPQTTRRSPLPLQRIEYRNEYFDHPLLASQPQQRTLPQRQQQVIGRQGVNYTIRADNAAGFDALNEALGSSAVQMISQLLRGSPLNNDRNTIVIGSRNQLPSMLDRTPDAVREGAEIRPKDFFVSTNNQRWNDEAKIMFGSSLIEKATKLTNTILNRLIPKAVQENDQKEMEIKEEMKPEDDQGDKEDVMEVDPRSTSSLIIDQNSEAVLEQTLSRSTLPDMIEPTTCYSNEESIQAVNTLYTNTLPISSQLQDSAVAQPIGQEEPEQEIQEAPVYVTINGRQVDITDTGIDLGFLNEIPEDMRQDVIDQHTQQQRLQSRQEELGAGGQEINMDFLNALPREIREEVLNQQLLDRRSRITTNQQDHNREEQGEEGPLFADLDRTMDPRQIRRNRLFNRFFAQPPSSVFGISADDNSRARSTGREALQVVSVQHLLALLRLMFVPIHTEAGNAVIKLLGYLAENHKTRNELVTLLLYVVGEAPKSMIEVDKIMNYVSDRNSKENYALSSSNVILEQENSGLVQQLVLQRCLDTLLQLMQQKPSTVNYFLQDKDHFGTIGITQVWKKIADRKLGGGLTKIPFVLIVIVLSSSAIRGDSQLLERLLAICAVVAKRVLAISQNKEEKKADQGKIEQNMDNKNNSRKEENPESVDAEPVGRVKGKSKLPILPDSVYKALVDVLKSDDCSSKAFHSTLSCLQCLFSIADNHELISLELVESSVQLAEEIKKQLQDFRERLNQQPGLRVENTVMNKLLRLLKTMDYLHSKKKSTPVDAANNTEEQGLDSVVKMQIDTQQKYSDFCSHPLWYELGKCLEKILEATKDTEDELKRENQLLHTATNLLPLMEAFMVVCKHAGHTKKKPIGESNMFYTFTDQHRKILNAMVRASPALMSGSFSLLVRNPKILEFDNKRNYFYQHIQSNRNDGEDESTYYGSLQMNVRRKFVFEDSFQQLQGRTGTEIRRGKLNVKFHDEEGVDAGGVTREWFQVLARQMFNPDYALFITSEVDKVTYQPNSLSYVNADHLTYFRFVGRIIAKAITERFNVDCYFTRSFYKHIVGRKIELEDMEAADPSYYKSLRWILDNDITDLVDLQFVLELEDFGTKRMVDLIEDGRNVMVTEKNKSQYVDLVIDQKLTQSIATQIKHFLLGFNDVVPSALIAIFNELELELLISGLPSIDIDDWRANTVYHGYTLASPQIGWLWRLVKAMDKEHRAKLLQFVTGTSKVPLDGFKALQGSSGTTKFNVHKVVLKPGQLKLPTAHTCFNQLDLPTYDSFEAMKLYLFMAIDEGATGFGFA